MATEAPSHDACKPAKGDNSRPVVKRTKCKDIKN